MRSRERRRRSVSRDASGCGVSPASVIFLEIKLVAADVSFLFELEWSGLSAAVGKISVDEVFVFSLKPCLMLSFS